MWEAQEKENQQGSLLSHNSSVSGSGRMYHQTSGNSSLRGQECLQGICCGLTVRIRALSDCPFSDSMSLQQFSGSSEGLLAQRENEEKIQILNISDYFTVISHGNEWLLITSWFSLTTGRKRDCYANLNNSNLCDISISHFKLIQYQPDTFLRSSVHFQLCESVFFGLIAPAQLTRVNWPSAR